MITIESLTKKYGHTTGVDSLELAVRSGYRHPLPPAAISIGSDSPQDRTTCLPGVAGAGRCDLRLDPGTLAPWTGFAVFSGYAVPAPATGGRLLRRRDA